MSELYKALFQLQGVIRGVKRDARNPHFKNSYASLEAVTDTIRPHMQEAGLFWVQQPGSIKDGSIEVTTIIGHAETGEVISSTMEMPLAKRDPQGAGSALTYCMRYSLMAILGLPPTDDDAETAIDREDSRPPVSEPPKSAASLKRENSWEKLRDDLAVDMVDVRSIVGMERVKEEYRARARSEKWPAAWMNALKDEFAYYKKQLATDPVDEIQDAFPGSRIVNETHKEAAE